ncbi:MAG TPA: 30S ribosomal protein S2 [Patescibacteria group bacterium]
MKEITLEELLEAGCHFGHQVTRQNPKARDFVFESRDNIHIIDLGMTKEGLDEAAAFVLSVAKNNGAMVVVGSKRQASPIILEEAKKAQEAIKAKGAAANLYTVTSRWIGGTLTNLPEVIKNFKKLRDLESKLKDDFEKAKYTKKEVGMWEKSRQKLEVFYGGIADMRELPSVLFVVDTHLESLAVAEANKMGIPVVGIVDTNADPSVVDYAIPANDDAVGSLELLIGHIMDAWVEGKTGAEPKREKKEVKKEAVKEETSEVKAEEKEEKPAKKATSARKSKKEAVK